MPKFSETEKEIIKQKMLAEGERLFTAFGIKKVSIDELVQATGIAKGSFYTFYPSKEHLYWDIVTGQQEKMWAEMDAFLKAHSKLSPHDLVKQTFLWLIEQISSYPLIKSMDNDTTEYLFRKLPKELIEAHTNDDGNELLKLQEYGVQFTCEIAMAAKIMQTITLGFFNLQQEDTETRSTIINTILDGVLKEIVSDKK